MNNETSTVINYEIKGNIAEGFEDILTPEALAFVAHLQNKFGSQRETLLKNRESNQIKLDNDELPRFLNETVDVRNSDWQASETPSDLQDRRTEITGPVDRKMVINALNSGAKVFMADFEDSNTPSWANNINGQINLKAAVRRTITLDAGNGKIYKLNNETATLKIRPRGWHLIERNFLVNGKPVSGALFDFGLFFYHNAHELLRRGSGPYFYLPKLENHLEARLWNDVFVEAQDYLGISNGTIKATVLIETILAAFEMEEIIYELKEHMAGLNAGRWDYIFSMIKKFNKNADFILPDRSLVTMRVPFMQGYTNLLVKTCHKRGVHAIGGMAAFIPNKNNPQVNEIALKNVADDKKLEASKGFDGTWVAHPGLVSTAMAEFNAVLGDKPNQKNLMRNDVNVTADQLLNVTIDNFAITENGLRTNINVGLQYISNWLTGHGAVAIHNLMEDVATAEISRAQVWQWLKHRVNTQEGKVVDIKYYTQLYNEEVVKLKTNPDFKIPENVFNKACKIFNELVLSDNFSEFLTLSAYGELM